jgi:hypothetical protein
MRRASSWGAQCAAESSVSEIILVFIRRKSAHLSSLEPLSFCLRHPMFLATGK